METEAETFHDPEDEENTQTGAENEPTQNSQPTVTEPGNQANKTTKPKNPCLLCGKPATSGTIQCTICSMWCHPACTKLSKEALKGLDVQAREVGHAYWACRSCMSFNHKWNAQMKETNRRQDATDARVEENSRNIEDVRKLLEATRKEMRDKAKETEGMAERLERNMEEELRERESRRLNLVMHGVLEPGQDIKEQRDRMEADKEECERIFWGCGARTRKQQKRFCQE